MALEQQPRAAVVTGAASGIGAAITNRLAHDGVEVLAVDRHGTEKWPEGARAHFCADLGTVAGNVAAIAAAKAELGQIDIVVANAGFQHVSPIEDFPVEQWEALVALLLTSPFVLAKHSWAELKASPSGGRFIVVASAHALVASPFKAGYVAAKHGALGLVKTLALEGAEHGISASAICPGYVRTPLVEKQIAAQARAHKLSEEQVLNEVILASQPIKRLIEPEEVAEVAAMLTGPYGRSFSGVPVTMDQGWSAR